MRYRLCHEAFLKDRSRALQKDHMSDGAVDGSLNHAARGRRAGPTALAIDPEHPQTNGRPSDHQRAKRLKTPHAHRRPFLYIYLQNVLKFPVQHLTDEAQQILHASLDLLFPLRRLVKGGRWGIQKNKNKNNKQLGWGYIFFGGGGLMGELVYKRATGAPFLVLT